MDFDDFDMTPTSAPLTPIGAAPAHIVDMAAEEHSLADEYPEEFARYQEHMHRHRTEALEAQNFPRVVRDKNASAHDPHGRLSDLTAELERMRSTLALGHGAHHSQELQASASCTPTSSRASSPGTKEVNHTSDAFKQMSPSDKLTLLTGLPPSIFEQPFLLPAHGGDWRCTLQTLMTLNTPSFLSSSFFTEEERKSFELNSELNSRSISNILEEIKTQSAEVQRRFYVRPQEATLRMLRECQWDMEAVAAKVNLKKNHPLTEHPQVRSVFFSFLHGSQLGVLRLSNSHISTSVEQHVFEQSVEFVTYMMAERRYVELAQLKKRPKAALVEMDLKPGVEPELVRRRGVEPELVRGRGVEPELVRGRGVEPELVRGRSSSQVEKESREGAVAENKPGTLAAAVPAGLRARLSSRGSRGPTPKDPAPEKPQDLVVDHFSLTASGELLYQGRPFSSGRRKGSRRCDPCTEAAFGHKIMPAPADFVSECHTFQYFLCTNCHRRQRDRLMRRKVQSPTPVVAEGDSLGGVLTKIATVPYELGCQFLSLLATMPPDLHTDFMRQCCGRLDVDAEELMGVRLVDSKGSLAELIPSSELEENGDGAWSPETVCPGQVQHVILQFPVPIKYRPYAATKRASSFQFRHWIISMPVPNCSPSGDRGDRNPHSRHRTPAMPPSARSAVKHATVYLSRMFDEVPGKNLDFAAQFTSLRLCALPGSCSEQLDKAAVSRLHSAPVQLDLTGLPSLRILMSRTDEDRQLQSISKNVEEVPEIIRLPENGATVEEIEAGSIFSKIAVESFSLESFVKLKVVPSDFLQRLVTLVSVDLSSPTIEAIEGGVLVDCHNLRIISLAGANNLRQIGHGFARNCKALSTFTFPEKGELLTSLGKRTLSGCPRLQSIDLSSVRNLEKIDDTFCVCALDDLHAVVATKRLHERQAAPVKTRLRVIDVSMLSAQVCSFAWKATLENQGTRLISSAEQDAWIETTKQEAASLEGGLRRRLGSGELGADPFGGQGLEAVLRPVSMEDRNRAEDRFPESEFFSNMNRAGPQVVSRSRNH